VAQSWLVNWLLTEDSEGNGHYFMTSEAGAPKFRQDDL
jgi:hypothetical protein